MIQEPPLAWISRDFVVVSSEASIMDILELILKLLPQYIIVTRRIKKKKLVYALVSFVLLKGIEKILPDPLNSLRKFLTLDDKNSDHYLDLPGYSLRDPEVREFLIKEYNDHKLSVLFYNHKIAGLVDPQRRNARGHYNLKGLNLEGEFFREMHSYDPIRVLTDIGIKYISARRFKRAEKYFEMLRAPLQKVPGSHPYP